MACMSSATENLGMATAALAVAAAALTAFGLRQRRYEGWRCWVVALWLTVLGMALVAASAAWATPAALALGLLLLMQWPVWSVVGLRRFHPRQALPGREAIDWAVLAATSLLAGGATLAGTGAQGLAVASTLVLHLYAATALFMGPSGRDFTPAQGLACALAASGLLPAAMALPGFSTLEPLLAQAAAAAMGAMVLAFVAITLVCERTERQLRDSRRRVRLLAHVDTLTQVPSRHQFRDLAEHALRQDEPGTATLLIFDVDHIKQINELFGHAAGDRALALVSSTLLDHLRAHDVPGRQGGNAFVLLLRHTGAHDALRVAGRIVHAVQRRAPLQQLPTVSMSFGVVQVGLGESIPGAMRRADQALYEAKRQGRSRAVAASGNEDQPVFAECQRLGLALA